MSTNIKPLKESTFSGKRAGVFLSRLREIGMFLTSPGLEIERELFFHALGHPPDQYHTGYTGKCTAEPVLNSMREDDN